MTRVIRGAFGAVNYSTAGGYQAGQLGETSSFRGAPMSRIDRFFLWTDRLSDQALAGGLAGTVVAFWLAFAAFGVTAWWCLR